MQTTVFRFITYLLPDCYFLINEFNWKEALRNTQCNIIDKSDIQCASMSYSGRTNSCTGGRLTASSWCAEVPPPAASERSGRRSGTDHGFRLPTPSPHCNTHKQESATVGGRLVVSALFRVRPPNAAELAVRCDVMRCEGGLGIAGKCQVNMCHSPQGLGVCRPAPSHHKPGWATQGPQGLRAFDVFISHKNFTSLDFYIWTIWNLNLAAFFPPFLYLSRSDLRPLCTVTTASSVSCSRQMRPPPGSRTVDL